MDNIEIVVPRIKRARIEFEILEDFCTQTFQGVVYTPECRPTPSEAKSEQHEDGQQDDEDEDGHEDQDHDDGQPAEHFSPDLFYERFVSRSPSQCMKELQAPQRSVEWLAARAHAITASSFGAAAGHNAYCSPKDLVIEKLWRTFIGNEYTQYGTFHEPDARNTFFNLLSGPLKPTLLDLCPNQESFDLFETGLLKASEQPWMAVSPDGLIRMNGPKGPTWALVEYKCPARLRDSEAHPYKKDRYNVPPYYMDQMQGIMGLLNKYPELLDHAAAAAGLDREGPTRIGPQVAFFVVWQPHQIHVTRVPFDSLYWSGSLEPALERWFFDLYLPYATLKANGELVENSLTASRPIIIKRDGSAE
jgi:hypothetical protein